MDPYIESQQRFHVFHTAFIDACIELLNEQLAPPYFATVEERILVDASEEGRPSRQVAHRFGPGVAVSIGARTDVPPAPGTADAVSLVPTTVPQAVVSLDRPTQKLIEIRGLPDGRLVTTVELLFPSNKKPGADREAFLLKRADLLRHGIHLVDIDLLLAGRRVPLLAPLPAGDYFAMVTREQWPDRCNVYAWSLRDKLPMIAIPLEGDTAAVPLDLATAFSLVYRRYHFDRQLRYDRPLAVPFADPDRAWAACVCGSASRTASIR
jgi:hypothetical protein